MSDQGAAEAQTRKELQEINGTEERREITDDDEEEEEVVTSALLEPSTLPWSADKHKTPHTDNNDRVSLGKRGSEPEDVETNGGSHTESDGNSKARWRESMPEGDRWRDDVIEVQQEDKRDGSLADDEAEEEEEEEEEEEGESTWISEKSVQGFTPKVTIVHPSCKEQPEECRLVMKKEEKEDPPMEPDSTAQFYPEWMEDDDNYYLCQHVCSEKVKVVLAMVAAAILFPLLVWGGYTLLPFDPPLVQSTPLRVVYTLRCSFFATIPLLLGMVVLGGARLRFNTVTPLYKAKLVNRHVAAHWHYINQSLALFLFYFLQLAVLATYISQDLVKLVPLLTIVFAFGRLIYWLCLAVGSSSIRALGFGLSFFPILVMLGANLYYVCSSVGQEGVFDVAPPTTAPPPRQRWWG